MSKLLYGLKPFINRQSKVLILGSFPGARSLEKQEYYANPRNHFWSIISRVLDADLVSMTYQKKIKCLLKRKIALWDIVKACRRSGSSDAAIKDAQANDINALLKKYPKIKAVALNGQKAAKVFLADTKTYGCDVISMPSTSPAHAVTQKIKYGKWAKINSYLLDSENA